MLNNHDLFRGDLVRLSAIEPQAYAQKFTQWRRDSLYWRLMDTAPAHLISAKAQQEWIEKELFDEVPDSIFFSIHTLDGDHFIGDIGLDGIFSVHRDPFVGIAVGDRSFWGKGYGTDAMRIILRYGFKELNLHRVSLDVFEYNPRAIRSYEKAGFKHEGRARGLIQRDGRRWDLLFMGILRDEWEATNGKQ